MSEAETRGYVILGLVDYLKTSLGEQGVARLPAELRAQLRNMQRNQWYPIDHFVAPLDLLAEEAAGNVEAAKEHMMNAAGHMSRAAINSFLKLLIKVMTPRMFARKLPDFYRHDVRGAGNLIVTNIEDSRIDVKLEGIQSVRHMPPVSAGWVAAALSATGQNIERVDLRDWTLETPSPATADFTVHWSA